MTDVHFIDFLPRGDIRAKNIAELLEKNRKVWDDGKEHKCLPIYQINADGTLSTAVEHPGFNLPELPGIRPVGLIPPDRKKLIVFGYAESDERDHVCYQVDLNMIFDVMEDTLIPVRASSKFQLEKRVI